MDKDDTQKDSDFDVLKTTADILGRHGKTDDEIRAFLEEQFPISSAVIDKILGSGQKKQTRKIPAKDHYYAP